MSDHINSPKVRKALEAYRAAKAEFDVKQAELVKFIEEHCKTEFESETNDDFCPACKDKIYEDGTIRRCDRCGHTWEVEAGDCGVAWKKPGTEEVMELCDVCAEKVGAK